MKHLGKLHAIPALDGKTAVIVFVNLGFSYLLSECLSMPQAFQLHLHNQPPLMGPNNVNSIW